MKYCNVFNARNVSVLTPVRWAPCQSMKNWDMSSTTKLSVFSAKNAMPTWEFQLVVAIYVLLMIMILSYLISGIVNGADRTEARYLMAKNLFKGTIVYSVVTFVATMILSQVAFAVTGAL